MAKRRSLSASPCPVGRSVDAVGDWWSLMIVRDALDGVRRFSDFLASLGIAKNMLATRLRTLVEREILEIVPASDGSAYSEYVLTSKGRGLFPVIVALRQWGEEFFFDSTERHVRLVDRAERQPVRKLELHAHDGRLLKAEDTIVC
ncbi:winged helix-turn-helix transcriptional regulator [Bradyrhizobium sp. STM 3562]|uniref:winged helix-turn-helix transcriptional regulator n=1 Tax=Bradyrhizobium sp. STM 3562 TaxID=578924 RepID=UPI00388F37B8